MIRNLVAISGTAVLLGSISALGCAATGVGDPCTPESEYDVAFAGFDLKEVNVESKSFQCQTRVCLVNHFQGRTSCPYGGKDCIVPGTDRHPVETGACTDANAASVCFGGTCDPNTHTCELATACTDANAATLCATGACSNGVCAKALDTKSACSNRSPQKAVYCSCRCANVEGRTDDGANYCKCGDGFTCTQLVGAVGAQELGLTGAYCIKSGTAYSDDDPTCVACDKTKQDCGSVNGK